MGLDYKTYSDDQLLQLVQSNDELAFKQIFERYWRKLYAIAYNRLQTAQSAEDIVQEVLTMLWVRRADLKINSLNNYLSTAIRYNVFHEVRKNIKKNQFHHSLKTVYEDQNQMTIEEELRYKVIEEQLQKEINKLPEKCRLVFQYSRELGMSNKDISKQLQISLKTVEAHITKSLKHLRSALKQTFSVFLTLFF
jgi:RNA polymerase sigma-70 factor (ECF subfamily)